MKFCGNFKNIYKDIIINGQIYNLKELINQFPNNNCKTEEDKIKYLFNIYNYKLFNMLEGQFLLLIYDKKENSLYLVRDKMGTKHLYYYVLNDNLYFSCDLKDIIEIDGFNKDIDINQLGYYLCRGFINAPNTIFKNVFKLESGEFIKFDGVKLSKNKYWNLYACYKKRKIDKRSFNIVKEELKSRIEESIKDRLSTASNVGIFLSGGIDSSLIAAICNKYTDKVINTYTIGFYESKTNEANEAKKIAEYLNTNHHEKYLNKNEALGLIKKSIKIYSEPFADQSIIPTILLNEFASKDNNSIILTGDGADQLFCGSTVYDNMNPIYAIRKILSNIKNKNTNYKSPFDIVPNMFYRKQKIVKKILNYDNAPIVYKNKCLNMKEKYTLFDISTYLENGLFRKIYYPSNYYNLKLNSPLSDVCIVKYSLDIKMKYKYYRGNKKYILKEILYDYMPSNLLSNEKKGFGIPLVEWVNEIFLNYIKNISNEEFLEKQNIFKNNTISQLINDFKTNKSYAYALILFHYYVFQLWYNEYINR